MALAWRKMRLLIPLGLLAVALHLLLAGEPSGALLGGAIGDIFLRLRAELGEFEADIKKAGDRAAKTMADRIGAGLAKAGKSMQSAGRTLTTNLTLPVVALGAAIFKVGSSFETTLNQIVGLTDVSREELGGIRSEILDIAQEVGRTPQELAEGFYFVASAGFEAEEAMDVLRTSAIAAAAGLGQTQDIAKVLGLTINAYGKENITAARAADILVAAVKDGTAEAADFAGVLGTVVPTAATLGVTFDQVTAAMAGMTLTGLSVEEAAVSLNQVMVSLLKPTAEAEKAMNEMGLSSQELREQLREKGLLSVLRTLEERFAGNDQAASLVFGNIRALRGVLSLLSLDSAQLNDIFEDTAEAQGDLAEGYAETEGSARDYQRAQAALEATLIELSQDVLPIVVEILREVANGARSVSEWWRSLSPETRSLIGRFATLAATLGPVLFFVGKLTSGVGALFKVFGGAQRYLGPVVKLFGGLGASLVKSLAGSQVATAVGSGLSAAIEKGGKVAGAAASRVGDFLGTKLGKGLSVAFAAVAVVELAKTFNDVKSQLDSQAEALTDDTAAWVKTATQEQIKAQIAAIEEGREQIQAYAVGIASLPGGALLANLLLGGSDQNLAEQDRMLRELLADLERGISHGGSVIASSSVNVGERVSLGIVDGIVAGAPNVAAAVADIGTTAMRAVAERRGEYGQAGRDLIDGVSAGITSGKPRAYVSARDVASVALAAVAERQDEFNQTGRSMVTGVADGIRAARQAPLTAFDQLKEDLKNRLTPAKEIARIIGQLTSTELANGLEDRDPLVRAQAEETRDILEDRLRQLEPTAKDIGGKTGINLKNALKSKDPQVRAAAERTQRLLTAELNKAESGARTAGGEAGDAFGSAAHRGAIAWINRLVSDAFRTFRQGEFNPSGSAPKRHSGGSVEAGHPYIVGRTGAEELFVPSTSGAVLTAAQAVSALAGAGGGGVTNLNIPVTMNTLPTAEHPFDVARQMGRVAQTGLLPHINRAMRARA